MNVSYIFLWIVDTTPLSFISIKSKPENELWCLQRDTNAHERYQKQNLLMITISTKDLKNVQNLNPQNLSSYMEKK